MTARGTFMTAVIALAVLCSLPGLVGAKEDPGNPAPERPAARRAAPGIPDAAFQRPALIRMFDADGSGYLDAEEREKARRAILKKFDRDGDGRLDEEERAALRAWLAAERRERAAKPAAPEEAARKKPDPAAAAKPPAKPPRPAPGEARQRRPGAEQVRNMVLRVYDADGDGVLNPAEARRLHADLAPILPPRGAPQEGRVRPMRPFDPARDAPPPPPWSPGPPHPPGM